MLWKLRKLSITIPAELHQQMARSCICINEIPSEVLRVRPLRTYPAKKRKQRADYGIGTRPAQ